MGANEIYQSQPSGRKLFKSGTDVTSLDIHCLAQKSTNFQDTDVNHRIWDPVRAQGREGDRGGGKRIRCEFRTYVFPFHLPSVLLLFRTFPVIALKL